VWRLILLLLTGCATPPEEEDDLWHCEVQGKVLVCVPMRSIDGLSGTRTAGSDPNAIAVEIQ
jgi:hypothetical protein